MAEANPLPLVAFQKVVALPPPTVSLNSVPPTAVLNGVEAKPLTVAPPAAGVELGALGSHPAAPVSPDETKALIPCAAACSHTASQNEFPPVPSACSQLPKLTFMIGARFSSTIKLAPSSIGSVVRLPPLTTTSIVALGATAPDHSVSRVASAPTPNWVSTPGSGPFKMMLGGLTGNPKRFRKIATSSIPVVAIVLMLLAATMAIV